MATCIAYNDSLARGQCTCNFDNKNFNNNNSCAAMVEHVENEHKRTSTIIPKLKKQAGLLVAESDKCHLHCSKLSSFRLILLILLHCAPYEMALTSNTYFSLSRMCFLFF